MSRIERVTRIKIKYFRVLISLPWVTCDITWYLDCGILNFEVEVVILRQCSAWWKCRYKYLEKFMKTSENLVLENSGKTAIVLYPSVLPAEKFLIKRS